MSENYKPVKGDRVRVVIEGEVNRIGGDDPSDFAIGATLVYGNSEHVISVEKVEPPVETFKPGDVVRNTGYPEHVYTLGKDGYYSHMAEKFYKPCGAFTSADYELVYRP